MSMLSDPRRKTKYSINPRGNTWSNDDNKFGQKLMEKFGWAKGKGLGAKEDGKIDHVKVALKNDTKGVGATKDYADNWIAHQDDFNSLLANLNQEVPQELESKNVSQLENKSKHSRSRVHYHKFTKGKDLSGKSNEDLDCIFGKRKEITETNIPTELEDSPSSAMPEKEETDLTGLKTTTSSEGIQAYFARKMAERKSGSNSPMSSPNKNVDNSEKATVIGTQVTGSKTLAKKHVTFCLEPEVRFISYKENVSSVSEEDICITDTDDDQNKQKKKKKKKRKKDKQVVKPDNETDDCDFKPKKRKLATEEEIDSEQLSRSETLNSHEPSKKKRKIQNVNEGTKEEEGTIPSTVIKKKSKRSKKKSVNLYNDLPVYTIENNQMVPVNKSSVLQTSEKKPMTKQKKTKKVRKNIKSAGSECKNKANNISKQKNKRPNLGKKVKGSKSVYGKKGKSRKTKHTFKAKNRFDGGSVIGFKGANLSSYGGYPTKMNTNYKKI